MDWYPDCTDSSDETLPLECVQDKEFECQDSGRCIKRFWRLNKIADCINGSDEIPLSSNETYESEEFLCHNHKRCITKTWVCDGIDHCGDCSDEIESCAGPRMYRGPKDPTDTCLHWDYSCDQYASCPNRTDDVTLMTGIKCYQNLKKYCVIPQYALKHNR